MLILELKDIHISCLISLSLKFTKYLSHQKQDYFLNSEAVYFRDSLAFPSVIQHGSNLQQC